MNSRTLSAWAVDTMENEMDSIKNYLMDMDGVILRGNTLIPGAVEFVQRLRTQRDSLPDSHQQLALYPARPASALVLHGSGGAT